MHPASCVSRREDALIAAGFTDIFLPIKARENASALELLPDVCAELDQHTEQVCWAGWAGCIGWQGGRALRAVQPRNAGRVLLHAWTCIGSCSGPMPMRLPQPRRPALKQLFLSPAAARLPHCLQRDRWDAVIRGVFAGNIFDLGCAATTSMYHEVRLGA